MQKKHTYKNYYYQQMLSKLNTKVYLTSSKAKDESVLDTISNNKKEDWVSTSKKEIELKKVLDYIKSSDCYNENKLYTYTGNLDFKKSKCRVLRKLLELEPRLIKDIYQYAEKLFNELKEEKIESKKYYLLYTLNARANKYNELLAEFKKQLKDAKDKWNSLHEYYSYPNDEYCDFDNLTEQQQIDEETEYNEKIFSIEVRISNIKDELVKINKKINDIFENGISDEDIANIY